MTYQTSVEEKTKL